MGKKSVSKKNPEYLEDGGEAPKRECSNKQGKKLTQLGIEKVQDFVKRILD